jgi:hypothetical protein
MKRILLVVLIVVVGGYGAAYWLIRSNVQTQLDETARLLSGTGRLTYGQIWVSPLGAVSVDNLSFDATARGGDFSIERSSLETDSLIELYQLGQTLRRNDIPERLVLSFEGIQLDLSGFQTMVDSSGAVRQDMLAAGCGEERTYFNFTDLDNMGFRQVRSDMVLEYRLSPGRDNLRVNSEFTAESMYRLSMLLDLDLADAQGTARMMGATLNQVQLRIDDLGYVPEVMAYCARETGLSADVYRARHVNAWEQLWQQQGVVLGDEVVAAYATFIDQPDSLRLESFARLNAMQAMMISNPQALLDRIAPQIVVNGGEPTPVQLSLVLPQSSSNATTAVNPEPAQAEVPGAAAEPSPEPRQAAQPRRIIEVPVAQLSDWLATDMIITLADGREFRGEALSLDERQVQFSQAVVGGTMVVPLELSSIRQVRVLNQ